MISLSSRSDQWYGKIRWFALPTNLIKTSLNRNGVLPGHFRRWSQNPQPCCNSLWCTSATGGGWTLLNLTVQCFCSVLNLEHIQQNEHYASIKARRVCKQGCASPSPRSHLEMGQAQLCAWMWLQLGPKRQQLSSQHPIHTNRAVIADITAWEEAMDETVAELRWQTKTQSISHLPSPSTWKHSEVWEQSKRKRHFCFEGKKFKTWKTAIEITPAVNT